ncbi:MAG: hypothetical protein ACE5R4_07240 [Armatimonadota bacterium]
MAATPLLAGLVVLVAACAAAGQDERVRLVPEIDGDLWHISNNPDLGELTGEKQQPVDHAIFQSTDGKWHLWSCVRGTKIGRLFFHWEGDSLEQEYWRPVGIAMRADRARGESIEDWGGQEWLQAPHVIIKDGLYHMLYGGHRSETGESQICLATSEDGRSFERYQGERGYSRLFIGPGEARDPMVIKVGEQYLCYYAGHDTGQREPGKFYCRTSTDLIHWSEPQAVCWGGSGGYGAWHCECPFVVHLKGYYYLFRTSRYRPAVTHVYRSTDPFDFCLDDDAKKICELKVSAPEVVRVGAQYYISSVEDLSGGIQLGRLRWVADTARPGERKWGQGGEQP